MTNRRIALYTVAAGAALGCLVAAGGITTEPAAAPAAAPVTAMRPAAQTGGQPLRIMPLGDSITYGVGSRTFESYRTDLRRRLAGAGLDVDFVGSQTAGFGPDQDNEGHPGWTIAQIAGHVPDWLDTYQPDAVLLHIGTNDMARSIDPPHAPDRLSALIDEIRVARPDADIFVAQITSASFRSYQKRIEAYNAALPAVVAAKDSRVHLLSQSSVGGLDLRDSVHPNDFGYAKMAFNWYRALEKIYNTSGVPWPVGVNPYLATAAYRCKLIKTKLICNWTHKRKVTEKYRVRVPAHDEFAPRGGTWVKIRIPATVVSRTRSVLKWVNG